MMELKDTIDLMTSEDYKERFKAEYLQAAIRCKKLGAFLDMLTRGEIPQRYQLQQVVLGGQYTMLCAYLQILRERAEAEGIELPEV